MQISQLEAANAFAADDVLAIEINGVTYKLTGATLAAALDTIGNYVSDSDYPITVAHGGTGANNTVDACNNISATFAMQFSSTDTTWAKVWEKISAIPLYKSVSFFSSTAAATVLTDGNITGVTLKGIITRTVANAFDVLAVRGASDSLYTWRISNATADSATISQLYRYYNNVDDSFSKEIRIGTNDTTWAKVYDKLNAIPDHQTGTIWIASASLLTGSKTTNMVIGTVCAANKSNGIYEFMCSGVNNQYIYTWRISGLTSATATVTVGTVYRYTGTSI